MEHPRGRHGRTTVLWLVLVGGVLLLSACSIRRSSDPSAAARGAQGANDDPVRTLDPNADPVFTAPDEAPAAPPPFGTDPTGSFPPASVEPTWATHLISPDSDVALDVADDRRRAAVVTFGAPQAAAELHVASGDGAWVRAELPTLESGARLTEVSHIDVRGDAVTIGGAGSLENPDGSDYFAAGRWRWRADGDWVTALDDPTIDPSRSFRVTTESTIAASTNVFGEIMLWMREDDGWVQRPSPGLEPAGPVVDIVRTPAGSLLAVSNEPAGVTTWLEDDTGNWTPSALDAVWGRAVGVAAGPSARVVVVGARGDGSPIVWVGDGHRWSVGAEGVALHTDAAGSAAIVDSVTVFDDLFVAGIRVGVRSGHEWCFDDVETCGQQRAGVMISPDGVRWRFLAVPDASTAPSVRPVRVFVTAAGLGLVHDTDAGTQASSIDALPGGETLRSADAPATRTELVSTGAELDQGAQYGYPLRQACDTDVLGEFNGTWWRLADQIFPAERIGELPTPNGHLYGLVRLADTTTLEYYVDGELFARYEPAPAPPRFCS